MSAEHKGGDIFDRYFELFSEEIAETRRVQDAGHADHHVLRQAGKLLQCPDHRIERVGDADDESVRGVFFQPRADLLHDFQINAKQIIAAHARLARHTGGNNAHIRAFDALIVIDADKA